MDENLKLTNGEIVQLRNKLDFMEKTKAELGLIVYSISKLQKQKSEAIDLLMNAENQANNYIQDLALAKELPKDTSKWYFDLTTFEFKLK